MSEASDGDVGHGSSICGEGEKGPVYDVRERRKGTTSTSSSKERESATKVSRFGILAEETDCKIPQNNTLEEKQ